MNYVRINKSSVTEGPGIRLTLFVSGCRNCCPGCHNPETWCFAAGEPYTSEVEAKILEHIQKPHIAGLTLCGGEPFEPENQPALAELCVKVKKYTGKSIWCYTGYELNDLLPDGCKRGIYTQTMLNNIDVLITGRYIERLRDITDNNRWRGSRNQRVLDLQESLFEGKPVMKAGIPNNN